MSVNNFHNDKTEIRLHHKSHEKRILQLMDNNKISFYTGISLLSQPSNSELPDTLFDQTSPVVSVGEININGNDQIVLLMINSYYSRFQRFKKWFESIKPHIDVIFLSEIRYSTFYIKVDKGIENIVLQTLKKSKERYENFLSFHSKIKINKTKSNSENNKHSLITITHESYKTEKHGENMLSELIQQVVSQFLPDRNSMSITTVKTQKISSFYLRSIIDRHNIGGSDKLMQVLSDYEILKVNYLKLNDFIYYLHQNMIDFLLPIADNTGQITYSIIDQIKQDPFPISLSIDENGDLCIEMVFNFPAITQKEGGSIDKNVIQEILQTNKPHNVEFTLIAMISIWTVFWLSEKFLSNIAEI